MRNATASTSEADTGGRFGRRGSNQGDVDCQPGQLMRKPHRPRPRNTVHFACFDCRKTFKQRGSSNWDPEVPARHFPCPNCKQSMVRLGKYFKAPRQQAARQWLKVELLYRFGERFEAGNERLDTRCKTLADAVAYLADTHPAVDVRATLEGIRNSRRAGRT